MTKILSIFGAAALLFAAGLPGSASAASSSKPAISQSQSVNTDVSSARRRVVVRRVIRRAYRPYYGYPYYSYGYAPYYYGPRYYGPGPFFPFFPFW